MNKHFKKLRTVAQQGVALDCLLPTTHLSDALQKRDLNSSGTQTLLKKYKNQLVHLSRGPGPREENIRRTWNPQTGHCFRGESLTVDAGDSTEKIFDDMRKARTHFAKEMLAFIRGLRKQDELQTAAEYLFEPIGTEDEYEYSYLLP